MTHLRLLSTITLLFMVIPFAQAAKPNVILLFADDMGYGDLGVYGSVINTPNIDNLAYQGIKFNQFYASHIVCSPSRASLLTGRSPTRLGFYSYKPIASQSDMHLKSEQTTIAEVLHAYNYQTVHLGKWHISCYPKNKNCQQAQPRDQGFDYSFGTYSNAIPSNFNPTNFFRNGHKVGKLQGYSADLLVQEMLDWLNNPTLYDPIAPFFIYMAFHEPHRLLQAPAHLVKKYQHYNSEAAVYYAAIENLDLAVGRVQQILKDKQLLEETIILFISDNGSYLLESNKPFKGKKGQLYEGGIRVPAIITWQQHLEQNKIINTPAMMTDIFPTLLDMLDLSIPPSLNNFSLNGQSLKPLLNNQPWHRTTPLLWLAYNTNPEVSLRLGDYILMGKTNNTELRNHYLTQKDQDFIKQTLTIKSYEMYHIINDPKQAQNLLLKKPLLAPLLKQFKQMQQLLISELADRIEQGETWNNLPIFNPKTAKNKK